MRELSSGEIEWVYGGQSTGDIVVIGNPKKGGTHDPGEPEFPVYPSSPGDPNGGGGGSQGSNIPHPNPNDPAVKSVDRSDLSPSSKIDLSSVTVEPIVLGTHHINVITDLKTLPLNSEQRATALGIMWYFNSAYDKLTAPAKEAINSLQNIVLNDLPGRSFSIEDKHTFYFDYTEIAAEKGSEAASNILHDANHIAIWDRTHDLEQSRGMASEVSGWQMQIDNAAAYGLPSYVVDSLKKLVADPSGQNGRVNTPPY